MRHLTKEQLLVELRRRPGLVPVEFESHSRQLKWLDLATYHFYEGFFHRGIDKFAALKRVRFGRFPESFVTDLGVLSDQRILVDPIYPTGFVFHAGRCGSTLLTRILARHRRHLVIGEAAAHNQVWLELTNNGEAALTTTEETKQVYKNLILAMGRRRLPGYKAHFIKFTSFNILFFNFIRSVFPDVPALFLYRKPVDILASYAKKPPGWFDSSHEPLRKVLAKAIPEGLETNYAFESSANVVAAFFSAGLRAGKNGARYMNYMDLEPINLPIVLRALNVSTTTKELTTMESQFSFDSKVDHRATPFVGGAPLQDIPAPECRARDRLEQLYDRLAQSDSNLVRPRS